MNSKTITKRKDNFRQWLTARGAEVLEPTSEWELMRFRAGDETSVIYRNKSEQVNFTGGSLEAWEAYRNNMKWRAAPKTTRKRRTRKTRTPIIISLFKRDGNLCFFCQKELGHDFTREHLVSITHGGPDNTYNMVLAHSQCNNDVGHLSAAEKIRIHVESVIRNANEVCSKAAS